jgi:hypothetical protein
LPARFSAETKSLLAYNRIEANTPKILHPAITGTRNYANVSEVAISIFGGRAKL